MSASNYKPEKLLSTAEVGTALKMSPQRVRQLIANGTIRATKVAKNWVIHASEIHRISRETTTSLIEPQKKKLTKGGMRSLSFFSGAMGLDLGLERAGIDTMIACESDKWARQTIASNRPDLPILGDIWRYDANEIRDISGFDRNDEIDVIAGGPPCQAFSTAGSRKGFDDIRGNVFLHFIDLIRALNPRYAVIENVRGLLSMPVSASQAAALHQKTGNDYSSKHGAIRLITDLLRESGYAVTFNLYNSANFGVPQNRERVVLIAARGNQPVPYLMPTHSDEPCSGLPPWRTVQEAFSDMTTHQSHYLPFPEKRLKYYRMLEAGQNWRDLPVDLQPLAMGKAFYLGGGKTGFYRRIAWNRPAPTLVTHPAMPATDLGHPEEDRPLSVEEYKAIQQFPEDWTISGNLQQQYKQIGNAVPLGLGEAIGRSIVDHFNGVKNIPPESFKFSRYRNTSDKEIAPDSSSSIMERIF